MREVSGDPGDNLERLGSFVRSRGIQLAYNENIAPARMTSVAKTQFRLLSDHCSCLQIAITLIEGVSP
jgi:hypothetical protein